MSIMWYKNGMGEYMNQSIKEQIIEVCGKEHGDLAKKILSYEEDIDIDLANLVANHQESLAVKIAKLRLRLREEEK